MANRTELNGRFSGTVPKGKNRSFKIIWGLPHQSNLNMTNHTDLDSLFNPDTIAMIGASPTPGKWGYLILLNMLKAGFTGRIYPVNPKAESILGFKCYPTVVDIPESVDLAIITIPSAFVSPVIDECASKQIRNIVLVTSNFSEAGKEGAALEKEIVAKAERQGLRIVGPNTMGIFSSESRLHALMPTLMPLHGSISMFSQSGNVGVQMMDYGIHENLGFSKFVSSGNEAQITCVDYLKYFAADEATKVIMGYVEGFELDTDLLEVTKQITLKKPVVFLKGGKSETGTKAAASHSGSLAGSAPINQGVFRQAGIVEAITSLELIDFAKSFANSPLPAGNRVGIITRGGGWGVLTADACEQSGLVVPPLPDTLIREIDKILPEYWNRGNPIDLVATIMNDPLPACLKMLVDWKGVDAVIVLGAGLQSFSYQVADDLEGPEELMKTVKFIRDLREENAVKPDPNLVLIADLVRQTGKPIVSVSMGSQFSHREFMEKYGILSFPTPERAVGALQKMAEYSRYLARN